MSNKVMAHLKSKFEGKELRIKKINIKLLNVLLGMGAKVVIEFPKSMAMQGTTWVVIGMDNRSIWIEEGNMAQVNAQSKSDQFNELSLKFFTGKVTRPSYMAIPSFMMTA